MPHQVDGSMEGWVALLRHLQSHHRTHAASSEDPKTPPPDMCPELSAFHLLPIAQRYGMRQVVDDCTALLLAVIPAK